jgi:hypothetical protein
MGLGIGVRLTKSDAKFPVGMPRVAAANSPIEPITELTSQFFIHHNVSIHMPLRIIGIIIEDQFGLELASEMGIAVPLIIIDIHLHRIEKLRIAPTSRSHRFDEFAPHLLVRGLEVDRIDVSTAGIDVEPLASPEIRGVAGIVPEDDQVKDVIREDKMESQVAVLLQPEMEKRHDRVIVELGRSFSDAKAP